MHSFLSSAKTAAVITLTFVAVPVASAGYLTMTQTYTQPPTVGPWATSVFFNDFNPALGTLAGVSMRFVGSFTQTLNLSVPVGAPAQTLTYFSSYLQLLVYNGPGYPWGWSSPWPATSIRGSGLTMDPGTSQTFESSGPLSWEWNSLDNPVDYFVGTGTRRYLVVPYIFSDGFDQNPGGLMDIDLITRSGGTLSMTYGYSSATTPASLPEPATFALVGALLVAGGLAHRH